MKRVFTFLLALVMVIPLGLTASASNIEGVSEAPYIDETERQIDLLIQDLVKLRFGSPDAQNRTASATPADSEAEIFDSLRELGVKIVGEDTLSEEEAEIMGRSADSFFEGFDTTNDDFFVTGPVRRRHGRSGYHVVTVRVVPKNANSVLGNAGTTTVAMYANKTPLSSFANNTVSIYAQKAIGLIPVVQWLPYEYLFMDWSDADVNNTQADYVINVNSATTAKYVYIADTDVEEEASYRLSLLDHSVYYHETHRTAWIKNGVAGSNSENKDYTIEGDYYAAPDGQAYQNFLISYYEKLNAPKAKYYEENEDGEEVLKHTVSARSGLYSPYYY